MVKREPDLGRLLPALGYDDQNTLNLKARSGESTTSRLGISLFSAISSMTRRRRGMWGAGPLTHPLVPQNILPIIIIDHLQFS